jgi:hypothetical protein
LHDARVDTLDRQFLAVTCVQNQVIQLLLMGGLQQLKKDTGLLLPGLPVTWGVTDLVAAAGKNIKVLSKDDDGGGGQGTGGE